MTTALITDLKKRVEEIDQSLVHFMNQYNTLAGRRLEALRTIEMLEGQEVLKEADKQKKVTEKIKKPKKMKDKSFKPIAEPIANT